jgi:hypothetical protein
MTFQRILFVLTAVSIFGWGYSVGAAGVDHEPVDAETLALLADDVDPDPSLTEQTVDLLDAEHDYPTVVEDTTFDKTLYSLVDPDGKTLIKIKLGKGGIKSRFLLIDPEGSDKTPIYLDLRGPFIGGGQGMKVIIRF